MTSILGIDLSSFQLNGALLVDDHPPVLRCERLGTAKDPLIERVRRVREAVAWMNASLLHSAFAAPDWVVIESAFGHGAHALHLTTGAIIASCPSESQVALISSGDWRKALGAVNTKQDGHRAVLEHFGSTSSAGHFFSKRVSESDEHELDAIGIALAWRSILAKQVAA